LILEDHYLTFGKRNPLLPVPAVTTEVILSLDFKVFDILRLFLELWTYCFLVGNNFGGWRN